MARTGRRRGIRTARFATVALVVAVGCFGLAAPAGAANPWVRVAVPSPSAEANLLFSVSCVNATTCTAVGFFYGTNNERALIMNTTNGSTWTRRTVIPPSPITELRDVSCTSPVQCTAVGTYFTGFVNNEINLATLVIRTTDGVTWSRVPSPNPGGLSSELRSVSCVTANRCRAVGLAGGRTLVLRTSNGTSWFREASPNRGTGVNELSAIDCVTNASCTAVGSYHPVPGENVRARTLVMRMDDGPPWALTPSPNPAPSAAQSYLNDVSCVSPTTCVTVGFVGPFAGTPRAFVLRTTNGVTWTRSVTPAATGEVELAGVDCQSATACTATGLVWNAAHDRLLANAILRTTNGTSWSSPSPSSEVANRGLLGVSCATEVTCVSVGVFTATGSTNDPRRPLVMRET
jgi:hypothetical protein